eukprot:SAG31_NODE_2916_length_4915_cov_43.966985_3_plen_126_part_00
MVRTVEYPLRILSRTGLPRVFRGHFRAGASKIIATCGSSYGRLAYAWADKVPRFVTFKSGLWSSRHTPGQCREALTAKPCAPRYQRALIGDSRHPQGSKATRCLTNDVAGLRAASQEAADECDVS